MSNLLGISIPREMMNKYAQVREPHTYLWGEALRRLRKSTKGSRILEIHRSLAYSQTFSRST